MVHGLETIVKKNDEAVKNAGERKDTSAEDRKKEFYRKSNFYSASRDSEMVPVDQIAQPTTLYAGNPQQ